MVQGRAWVVTEGYVGLQNQALGLAEAIALRLAAPDGLAIETRTVAARQPWRSLPPRLWLDRLGLGALTGDALAPPWPDLLISCGGQAGLAAALVGRLSGGRTFTVHIQRPPLPPRNYDVLVVPKHDALTAPNAIVTDGAVHRVTAAKLAEAATRFAARYAALPRPRVAVLIGGSNKRYRLAPGRMRLLAAQLAALADGGAGLMVTPSRRTEPAAARILADALAGRSADVWDGSGDNPYFALLALADHILVTRDSVSMASEAAFNGKPVQVIDLDGHSRRIELFHDNMQARGYTRRFAGTLDRWTYAPPDDTGRAAALIVPLLRARLDGANASLPGSKEG